MSCIIKRFNVEKIFKDENMTQKEDIYKQMPFFVLAYIIYKNKLDYELKIHEDLAINHEIRYLIQIHNIKNLSQDELAELFGQSKGTIAKHLKILEEEGYITREIDKNNRRKYILKTTKKGEKFAYKVINQRKILFKWL